MISSFVSAVNINDLEPVNTLLAKGAFVGFSL